MISATSTWKREHFNPSTTLTAKCADLSAGFERPDKLGQDCPYGDKMIGFHELDASGANYIWSIDDAYTRG